MKNLTQYIVLVLSIMGFTACDSSTDLELTTDTIIVDAYLYANEPVDSIRFTKSNSYSDETGSLVTFNDLDITITGDNQSFTLSPMGDGYYQNLNEIIQLETTYELSFDYNGETIYASTYIPAKKEATMSVSEVFLEKIEIGQFPSFTQIDPIEISWNNDEGDYYYVVVHNIEENPTYINENLASGNFRIPFQFISEPSIMNSYNIDTRREIRQFGTHEVIIYRVNPEYAALYATSGSTSTSITQPPTNIENGLGIFTGVSSDTLYLEVKEL